MSKQQDRFVGKIILIKELDVDVVDTETTYDYIENTMQDIIHKTMSMVIKECLRVNETTKTMLSLFQNPREKDHIKKRVQNPSLM